jgi:hypothetical protein
MGRLACGRPRRETSRGGQAHLESRK